MIEKNVRMGIVGIGGMGSSHAASILEGKVPGAELTAVADLSGERLEKFPEQKRYKSARGLFRSGRVDAVVIATPHFSHVPLAVQALKAGLHVLVEKPVGVHKLECEKVNAVAQACDLKFGAMFNQRTDPRYGKLKRMIDGGELGKVLRIHWTVCDWFRTQYYFDSEDWRGTWSGEGGGVLLNQAPHQLDLWQWLFGMPSAIFSLTFFGKHHNIEVEDEVTAVMEYEDGRSATFITSTGEAPGVNRLEIVGELGRVELDGSRLVHARNSEPSSKFIRECPEMWAAPESEWSEEVIEDRGEQHLGILKNFALAILGKKPLIAPATEGIRSVELNNAMIYSALKRRQVRLPLSGRAFLKEYNRLRRGPR
jgi:predicted dehydrogenase